MGGTPLDEWQVSHRSWRVGGPACLTNMVMPNNCPKIHKGILPENSVCMNRSPPAWRKKQSSASESTARLKNTNNHTHYLVNNTKSAPIKPERDIVVTILRNLSSSVISKNQFDNTYSTNHFGKYPNAGIGHSVSGPCPPPQDVIGPVWNLGCVVSYILEWEIKHSNCNCRPAESRD